MKDNKTTEGFTADDDFELLSKRVLYKGFFRLDEYRFKHRLFAGGWSGEIIREVFERGHAVVVLPYDPILDKVVLIEQLRVPALATTKSIWLLELVAGMIEPGESPEQVASRELFEEAGLTASHIDYINSYLVSPGGTSERFYLYIGRVDASQPKGLLALIVKMKTLKCML